MLSQAEKIDLLLNAFNVSIEVKEYELEKCDDDGYGNSHYKGRIRVFYSSIEFDLKRVNRELVDPVFKINGQDATFIDHNEDTRGNGIREEINIFQSFLMDVAKNYHSIRPLNENKEYFYRWRDFRKEKPEPGSKIAVNYFATLKEVEGDYGDPSDWKVVYDSGVGEYLGSKRLLFNRRHTLKLKLNSSGEELTYNIKEHGKRFEESYRGDSDFYWMYI